MKMKALKENGLIDGTFAFILDKLGFIEPEDPITKLAVTMMKTHYYETNDKNMADYRDVYSLKKLIRFY